MIWDWRKERPGQETYGDIIILFKNSGFSDQLPLEKVNALIGERKPILKIPYTRIARRGYLEAPFKTQLTDIEVYDLKR
jgi:hypothetical protein